MKYLRRFAYSFTITSIALSFLTLVYSWRLHEVVGYVRVFIMALAMAALIAASISIFTMKKGHDITKVCLGILPLLPIPFFFHRVYNTLFARAAWLLLILFALAMFAYAIAVIVVSKRVKKDEKELNGLLKDHPASEPTEKK